MGGSFGDRKEDCASDSSREIGPVGRDETVGFRIALVPKPPKPPKSRNPSKPAPPGGENSRSKEPLDKNWLFYNDSRTGKRAPYKSGDKKQFTVDASGASFSFVYCGKKDEGFWIHDTEITQKTWFKVMGKNPSAFKGDDNPVENVSWNECQEFIQKLNESGKVPSGWRLALPTREQWQFACAAGKGKEIKSNGFNYPWGVEWNDAFANGNRKGSTVKVRDKTKNAWGIYGTIGNVREWIEGGSDEARLCIGGSYLDDKESLSFSKLRPVKILEGKGDRQTGFRLVLIPKRPDSQTQQGVSDAQ
ncbi:MAG: formylglycine-generating enzyme family protein [Thermoguttaceae bacterium]|nr:formylglycine-generating enzyme family protein [Thermoguttaceae bacterium]